MRGGVGSDHHRWSAEAPVRERRLVRRI